MLLDNRYRAIDFLGAGGMGRNFLAVDERTPTKKRCVIKQLFPAPQILNNSREFLKAVELFNREAAQLDQLGDESPQIPRLLAYIEQDQRLYFVQEFINGQNLLKELGQRGTYSESQIYQLLTDLLPVLKFIHDRGVIHRDIKPENIMRRCPPTTPQPSTYSTPSDQGGEGGAIGSSSPPYRGGAIGSSSPPYQGGARGGLVLIDFGLSKQLSGTITTPGTIGGTQGYAPPEQLLYGEAYPASDLYALGATCIHLLTGIFPRLLYNPQEKRWLWRDVLASRGVTVSSQLEGILDKMLKTDVKERWQSADEVLAVLNPAMVIDSTTVPLLSCAIPETVSSPLPVTSLYYTSWRCVHTLTGHTKAVLSITISPDGQTLASGSADHTIKLWQLSTGRELRTLGGGWFSSGHSNSVLCLAISPDGQLLASGSKDNTIKLWDISTGRSLRTLKGHLENVLHVAFERDEQTLRSRDTNAINLWEVSTGRKLGTSYDSYYFPDYSLTFSRDGQILARTSDKTIKLEAGSFTSRREICTLTGHLDKVVCIAFSPDGKTLVSGSIDKTIKIWRCD
jgi:serine/threonine protein kinase